MPSEKKPDVQHCVKRDVGKEMYTCLPWRALKEVAKNGTMGNRMYGQDNWRSEEDENRWLNAGLRHIQQHMAGDIRDASDLLAGESTPGLHLAKAAWNLLAAAEVILKREQLAKEKEAQTYELPLR